MPSLPTDPLLENGTDDLDDLDLSRVLGTQGMSFDVSTRPHGIGTFEEGPDGVMRLVPANEDELPSGSDPDFTQNLANNVGEEYLTRLATELSVLHDDDIESRRPHSDRYRRGMQMMGLIKDEVDDGPFPGASTAVMPVISEAVVQFWARAFSEQVPPEGPAKAHVQGKASEQLADRAERIAGYMNYEMMYQDRGWFSHHSRMLFALPKTGSCFKKTYYDPQLGRTCGIYVAAEDFITNYSFTDLETAPRYTHRIWMTKNEYRKGVHAGMYLDAEIGDAQAESFTDETEMRLEASDFEPGTQNRNDHRYEMLETYAELDLEGFEDQDEHGPTGIALPYIVTYERHSRKIVSIYRDWKKDDPLKRRRTMWTRYDYLPGDGFYGYGLLHLIGGLQEAATGALRLIIDGAASASLQGGFITKDASLKDEVLTVEPGVWKQIDATSEDLAKAFFTPPFKEASPVLFQIMGFLVQRAEKFAATTEMQVGGENAKNAPVGSTAAMIEAGSKVFSTIHKGLHKSLADELRVRFEFIQEFMPPNGYPYDVDGNHDGIFKEDFAPGVTVVPVSDPNIFSTAQRVALNQAIYDLAIQNPDLMKKSVALRRVLEGLKVPDVDELLVDTKPPPPMDPVSEVQSVLRGDPVQAYPDQDHQAYLQHYWAFVNNPQYGANPQVQEQIGPRMAALIGQRLGYAWAAANRVMGNPAPMLPPPLGMPQQQLPAPGGVGPQPGPGGMPSGPGAPDQPAPALPTNAPPEVIAQIGSRIAPNLINAPGLPPPPQPGQATDQAKAQAITQESGAKVAGMQQQQAIAAQQNDLKIEQDQRNQQVQEALAQMQADMKAQGDQQKADAAAQAAQLKDMIAAAVAAQQIQHRQQAHEQQLAHADTGVLMDAASAGSDDERQNSITAHNQSLAEREHAQAGAITQDTHEREMAIREADASTARQTNKKVGEAKAKAAAKGPKPAAGSKK